MGCHTLLQGIFLASLMSPALAGGYFTTSATWEAHDIPDSDSDSEVAQSCPTLRDPMDCSLPGSSVHGIFQAIVLEWIARPLLRTTEID